MATAALPNLIILPQSHYCDRAAWALTAAGVAHTVTAHAIPTYLLYTQVAYGSRSTPILVRPAPAGGAPPPPPLLSSDAILAWVAKEVDPSLAPPTSDDVALEATLSARLGVHARRFAYEHVLAAGGSVLGRLSCRHLGAVEGAVYKGALAAGVVGAYLRRGLALDAAAAARSLAVVRSQFDAVSARLAAQAAKGGGGGTGRRRFLGGDGSRLTTLDITWGALAAPVLFPPGHYARVATEPVALEELPSAYQDAVRELRATPAGEFGLWLMEEVRWARGGRPAKL